MSERRVFGDGKDPLFDDDSYSEEEQDFTRKTSQSGYQRFTPRPPSFNVLASTDISPKVQNYLGSVYRNLAATTGAAAIACFLHLHNMLPSLSGLAFLASIGLLMMLMNFSSRLNATTRFYMLLGFGFLQGWEVAPLIHDIWDFDPDTVMMSIFAAVIAFVSFSGTALFSGRRSYLYLGGLLGTLSMVSLLGSFVRSFYSINLYLGLFTFCFYIIYNTQLIVERAEAGRRDDVSDALSLFTNLVSMFIRILLIFRQQSQRRRNRSKERR